MGWWLAGVNPADQRWGFWPLLPLGYPADLRGLSHTCPLIFCATGDSYMQLNALQIGMTRLGSLKWRGWDPSL